MLEITNITDSNFLKLQSIVLYEFEIESGKFFQARYIQNYNCTARKARIQYS